MPFLFCQQPRWGLAADQGATNIIDLCQYDAYNKVAIYSAKSRYNYNRNEVTKKDLFVNLKK